ncbi:MAG TPA: hypothetical protein IGR64_07105 [Leptolyngbyaceae cyanobacterium M65_K2018_010]|nr:hypothetical protein [Leptolyngbyaceae cyanobacterium M65_K2018_010]
MVYLPYLWLLTVVVAGLMAPLTPAFSAPMSLADQAVEDPAIAPSYCPGVRFSIQTPPLSSEPYIQLTVDGQTGPFLIDYAATASSVEKGVLATGDAPITLAGPALPGLPEQNPFLVSDRDITALGVGDQLGVIGTDMLSQVVVEMRYDNANDEHLLVSRDCDTRALAEQGFWRFDQTGFFSADPTQQIRPNVPVLFIDFQAGLHGGAVGTKTWAQLDSGYGDGVRPYSIDINEAYYAQLVAADLPLVEVDSLEFNDCQGTLRTDRVYVLPGYWLRLEDAEGAAMYRQASFYLVRKGQGSGQCGGIATMDEPAAQFGASFLRVLGQIIFDPANESVWVLPTTFR